MTQALHDRLPPNGSVREPPYRNIMDLTTDERAALNEKLGSLQNYNPVILRELARRDRKYLAPLIMAILSAEFRGIDFFGRFVVDIQSYNVPWHMTLAFARQTFDEARHTQLNMGILEHLGSEVGEYPDIILGPQRGDEIPEQELDPAVLMARINVALEGFALTTFEDTRKLAEEIGEDLIERCHDYNMADEVTHVSIGDYWLERLCEEQPWRKERAKAVQEEFDKMMAMVREMALQYAGSAAGNGGTKTAATGDNKPG